MIGRLNNPRQGISWRSHDIDRVVHAAIIHVAGADAGADAGAVAGAVADTDETYGAQAAAEKNTFTNTNNSANYACEAESAPESRSPLKVDLR